MPIPRQSQTRLSGYSNPSSSHFVVRSTAELKDAIPDDGVATDSRIGPSGGRMSMQLGTESLVKWILSMVGAAGHNAERSLF